MSPHISRAPGTSRRPPLHELRIGDFMSRQLMTVHLDDVMDTVLERMASARRACVVVVASDGAPVGIIREQDLNWYLSWVRSGAVWSTEAAQAVRARTLMQGRIIVAEVEESVSSVLERMRTVESRDVPVVDPAGTLVGLVTQTDLFGACARAAHRATPVSSPSEAALSSWATPLDAVRKPVATLIRRDVVHLSPSDPIQDAIDLMAAGRISCILITIELRPVGILTERDVTLLSSVVDKPFARARDLAQVMQSALLTVHESESIYDAMSLLDTESIRHLPVVDERGRLVGVVTQTDLLLACRRAFQRVLT